MGFMSRRVLPVCGNMCICCPALRSRSRQPVKRYKKLLADIFPKALDGPPNERKIIKLCEYATKNPFRIPKIANYLEQRSYKELRCEHFKFVKIIMETYNKLLLFCKGQMAYFAVNLLNVILELLDPSREDTVRILGCQTLTNFIYTQADGTYIRNIESSVLKVCMLAREVGEERHKQYLRASSLQCLTSMVWFMAEFSHIYADFDEIVNATLENYGVDIHPEYDESDDSNRNWVNEVVRCEARSGGGLSNDVNTCHMIVKPRPEIKDPSVLTREETEMPQVWAQICIQKMVEFAKEPTTMRRVLDPMFLFLDTGRHWVPRQGLAMVILSDLSYLMESSGNEQFILAATIRHLDHKNVAYDPQTKSYIIQICTSLARQLGSRDVVAGVGVVSDLCRHLRKSLQATIEVVTEQESNWNVSLQNSIEDCLLEIAKKIGDARPLFDMMAITLEKLPTSGLITRATIGSLLILAHIISLASVQSYSQQIFPEALLLQLLKTMMHTDVETRIAAHRIFAVLLLPTFNHPRHEFTSFHSDSLYEPRRWHSKATSAFASVTALLEKLRKEKECSLDKHVNGTHDHFKEREVVDDERKHGCVDKSSPNFYRISCSIIDRKASSTNSVTAEPNIIKLSEDQTAQLLSAFWLQANLPDNLPPNFEAIAHSFSLTLLSSRLKGSNHNNVLRSFQLPLSLRSMSLDPNGIFPPACQRSILTLATAMLIFAAKIYNIPELIDLLKTFFSSYNVDPFVNINDDLQLYVTPQVDIREYGTDADQQAAISSLSNLMVEVCESEKALVDIITRRLSGVIDVDVEILTKELSETFTPDDTFLCGPQSILDLGQSHTTAHSKESLSFDEEFSASLLVEDDLVSESSAADLYRPTAKFPATPSVPCVIGVGQLLESALEIASQVAGANMSTSPLPYNTMASHCEALGTGTRKKLLSWLNQDSRTDRLLLTLPMEDEFARRKVEVVLPQEPWQALRLPPASPFDNFLKAARY